MGHAMPYTDGLRRERCSPNSFQLTAGRRLIPQKVKSRSGVYVAHGEYGYELGEINVGSDSLKSRLKRTFLFLFIYLFDMDITNTLRLFQWTDQKSLLECV